MEAVGPDAGGDDDYIGINRLFLTAAAVEPCGQDADRRQNPP